jgi:hypothetical protein
MAGLVPDIDPNDAAFDVLKAITIAMDVEINPSCSTHVDLLRQFQESLANGSSIHDIRRTATIVETLVCAALTSGVRFNDRETKRIKSQSAAKARAAKDSTNSQLINGIIKILMRRRFPSLSKDGLRSGITVNAVATRIYPDVVEAIKVHNLLKDTVSPIGLDAVRKRVHRLIANWQTV